MATRRIKEITNTATTFASDDFIALDGTSQGTRKMDKDDLIAEVSAGVSGDYLEEANNLSDVASLDTSKLNMEIPDVGTSPQEVPLNGMLGSMAYQSADSVSVDTLEVTGKVDGNLGIGTTSPDQLIHASSSTGASLRLERDSVTITSGQSYGAVEWEGQDASGGGAASGVRAKIETEATGSSGDVALKFYTAAANDVATERVTISSSGNVSVPSGQVQVVSGAASAPSYAFDGDTDTGISRPTTNAINFVTGGTERWRINASGNLVANGTAIDFGSTTTGSGTVATNGGLLADYEFGDFTMTAGGTWTVTPTAISGKYVKVGNLVTCYVVFTGSPTKASSTSGWLQGLPFATNVYAGLGSVSDTSVADRGNCYAGNTDRLWLTGTSFGATNYATVSYRHD